MKRSGLLMLSFVLYVLLVYGPAGVRAQVPQEPPLTSAVTTALTAPEVHALYRQQLCRDADPVGLAAFADNPQIGDAAQLRFILASSAEGHRVTLVRRLYHELLGRDPLVWDCPGLRGWVATSLTAAELRTAIQAAPECCSRRKATGQLLASEAQAWCRPGCTADSFSYLIEDNGMVNPRGLSFGVTGQQACVAFVVPAGIAFDTWDGQRTSSAVGPAHLPHVCGASFRSMR